MGEKQLYPLDISDEDLRIHIRDKCSTINKHGSSSSMSHNEIPFIQLGLIELQGRESKRVNQIAMWTSGISICIAFLAILIALSTSRSTGDWKNSQLEILKKIESRMIVKK